MNPATLVLLGIFVVVGFFMVFAIIAIAAKKEG